MHRTLKYTLLVFLSTILIASLDAQEPAVMNDSAAMALVRHNADSLLNSQYFVTLTGYQKKDTTDRKSVV